MLINDAGIKYAIQFRQFSRSVMSNSLRPHESQHARPPCPSPTPRVLSNSRPSSPWCHPAISSLLLLPPIPPSIRVFSNESTLHMRWPKYWSFSFSIIPSREIPGLISFRMDWLDLLAVQGTMAAAISEPAKGKDRAREGSPQAPVFYNPVSQVTSRCFCCILTVRSCLQVHLKTQVETIIQCLTTRRWASLGLPTIPGCLRVLQPA